MRKISGNIPRQRIDKKEEVFFRGPDTHHETETWGKILYDTQKIYKKQKFMNAKAHSEYEDLLFSLDERANFVYYPNPQILGKEVQKVGIGQYLYELEKYTKEMNNKINEERSRTSQYNNFKMTDCLKYYTDNLPDLKSELEHLRTKIQRHVKNYYDLLFSDDYSTALSAEIESDLAEQVVKNIDLKSKNIFKRINGRPSKYDSLNTYAKNCLNRETSVLPYIIDQLIELKQQSFGLNLELELMNLHHQTKVSKLLNYLRETNTFIKSIGGEEIDINSIISKLERNGYKEKERSDKDVIQICNKKSVTPKSRLTTPRR